jgi:hypothetical protein
VGSGLIFGLIFGLSFKLIFNLTNGLGGGLRDGLVLSLAVGLLIGGLACLQHLVLRGLLTYNDLAPLNYVRFLDEAPSDCSCAEPEAVIYSPTDYCASILRLWTQPLANTLKVSIRLHYLSEGKRAVV